MINYEHLMKNKEELAAFWMAGNTLHRKNDKVLFSGTSCNEEMPEVIAKAAIGMLLYANEVSYDKTTQTIVGKFDNCYLVVTAYKTVSYSHGYDYDYVFSGGYIPVDKWEYFLKEHKELLFNIKLGSFAYNGSEFSKPGNHDWASWEVKMSAEYAKHICW